MDAVNNYRETNVYAKFAERSLILTPFVAVKNIAVGVFNMIANRKEIEGEGLEKYKFAVAQAKHGLKTLLPVIGWAVVIATLVSDYRAEKRRAEEDAQGNKGEKKERDSSNDAAAATAAATTTPTDATATTTPTDATATTTPTDATATTSTTSTATGDSATTTTATGAAANPKNIVNKLKKGLPTMASVNKFFR